MGMLKGKRGCHWRGMGKERGGGMGKQGTAGIKIGNEKGENSA